MTLDVVLVNYRSGPRLDASLPALQSFAPDASVIVVDNSPGDASARVVHRCVPGSRVITNIENRGFAAAVNQGVRAGTGDLVLLANPDIQSVRGALATVEAEFDRDPRLAAVGVRLLNPDGSLQRSCRTELRPFDLLSETLALHARFPRWRRARRFRMLDWAYDDRRYVDFASGALLFLRRAAIQDVGPFDERFFVYYEEADWLVRAKANGWRTLFCPEIEAVHDAGTSSGESPDRLSLLLAESQHRYARKHFGPIRATGLRAALCCLDLARGVRASVPGAQAGSASIWWARLRLHLGGFER